MSKQEPFKDKVFFVLVKFRTLRLAAYRQFTWWVHTRLGKAVRKVIPSCAVWSIRDAFPEANYEYTLGFDTLTMTMTFLFKG